MRSFSSHHRILASLLALVSVLAYSSCNGSAETEEPTASPAPKLVSSDPASGATDITGTSLDLVLTMDQNVKVSSANMSKVTVDNGAAIQSVYAYNTTVTIKVSGLEEGSGSTYTVSVPAGVIEGYKSAQEASAAITVKFTMKYVEPEKHYGRDPQTSLTNTKATSQARKLYEYLLQNYGSKTLSGAMGGTAWETSYTDYIAQQTGKYPAIVGFDYLFNNWPAKAWDGCPDYSDITPVKTAWEANNIIQIGWHWCVPPTEGTTDINNYSYNTKSFGVKKALTEGTWQNENMKKQVAQIAGYLKLLQEAGIPVLFRPLHEAAGDYTWGAWFWWGYDGADACKQLWKYLHDTLQETYGLNNLIWVWTVQTSSQGKLATVDQLEEWYPGDEYVDIVGADLYVDKNTTQQPAFQLVNDSVKGKKMVVLSEFGNLLDIDGYFSEDAPWGYFMNWCNFVDGKPVLYSDSWNNTVSDWKAALSNSHTINRDNVPSLK